MLKSYKYIAIIIGYLAAAGSLIFIINIFDWEDMRAIYIAFSVLALAIIDIVAASKISLTNQQPAIYSSVSLIGICGLLAFGLTRS